MYSSYKFCVFFSAICVQLIRNKIDNCPKQCCKRILTLNICNQSCGIHRNKTMKHTFCSHLWNRITNVLLRLSERKISHKITVNRLRTLNRKWFKVFFFYFQNRLRFSNSKCYMTTNQSILSNFIWNFKFKYKSSTKLNQWSSFDGKNSWIF